MQVSTALRILDLWIFFKKTRRFFFFSFYSSRVFSEVHFILIPSVNVYFYI